MSPIPKDSGNLPLPTNSASKKQGNANEKEDTSSIETQHAQHAKIREIVKSKGIESDQGKSPLKDDNVESSPLLHNVSTLGKSDILQSPGKIISQVKNVVEKLEDGWAKERLFQQTRFCSEETPMDILFKEKIKEMSGGRFGEPINDVDAYFNEKVKPIKKSTLKNIFSISTAQCYDTFDVTGKKVVVSGSISSDGWGDYFQMWLTATNLTENLPGASVAISTSMHGHRIPPKLSSSFIAKNLTYTSIQDFKEKGIEQELKAADLIIAIPHGYPQNPGGKPLIRVEEYGFNQGSDFALGFHFFNQKILGIPLTRISPAKTIQELSHNTLRSVLTDKNRPFFLGYLKKDHHAEENHRAGFVLAAAASQATQSNDIDIICPLEDIHKLDLEALKALNVGRIVLMEGSNEGELKEKETLTLKPEGKEIRIINPFPLTNDDWMLLLKFCEPLVGCTGDMSFSEVISNQKIPFYQIRWHKAEFVEQLIEMAGYVYKEDFTQLHQFLELMKTSLQENGKGGNFFATWKEMGKLLNSGLVGEAQKFAQRIQKNYCTNQILASKVKRELAYAEHPELKMIEKEIFGKWQEDKISLKEAIAMLQSCIDDVV
jgi:hypothetical protein